MPDKKAAPKISVFIGMMGSGKTFQAQTRLTNKATVVDFKDELLTMVGDLLPGYVPKVPGEAYEQFKTRIIGMDEINQPWMMGGILSKLIKFLFPKVPTGREILQHLGTEVIRKRSPDFWAISWSNTARAHLSRGLSVSVTDARFTNEWEEIFKLHALGIPVEVYVCNYKSARLDRDSVHESEKLNQFLVKRFWTPKDKIIKRIDLRSMRQALRAFKEQK